MEKKSQRLEETVDRQRGTLDEQEHEIDRLKVTNEVQRTIIHRHEAANARYEEDLAETDIIIGALRSTEEELRQKVIQHEENMAWVNPTFEDQADALDDMEETIMWQKEKIKRLEKKLRNRGATVHRLEESFRF